jgi:hypothetical protein
MWIIDAALAEMNAGLSIESEAERKGGVALALAGAGSRTEYSRATTRSVR